MNFVVIQGGRDSSGLETALPVTVNADAAGVAAEARRRIRTSGYDTMRARHLATGVPIPRDLVHLKMQIDYAASALTRLKSIPADFADDRYWPS